MVNKTFLGYEVGTGEEIFIKPSHLVVTGVTQESGKTTCLNALMKRTKNSKAIIFKTKIGEKGITEGTIIQPYYKDTFDWEYASEIMESHRKEKLKFERAWIIKYSKGANSLIEFKKNIDEAVLIVKRDLEKNVLITLQAYLDKILPELQYAPLSNTLDLRDGINIMDLERFKEETQGIIIRSVLKEVLEKEKNTILVIPECWKYIPEKTASPVKRVAESYVRQGATNKNFLFLDSQDMTGVSKRNLKQVTTWIMGHQSEINEIKRTLDQLPIPAKNKPKPDQIATLKLGHFYVATTEFTKQVYVCPSWMDKKTAKKIALGKIKVEDVKSPENLSPFAIDSQSKRVTETTRNPIVDMTPKLNSLGKEIIEMRNDFFNKIQEQQDATNKIYQELFNLKNIQLKNNEKLDLDEIVSKVLQKMPTQKYENNNSVDGIGADRDAIINEVLSRVPINSGTVIYEVSPLEKIKKDFLEESKNKILADIQTLKPDEKKVLKYLESRNKDVGPSEIITKCLLLKVGGTQSTKVSNILKALKSIEVVDRTTGGRYRGILRERINSLLSNHTSTNEEIDNLYDHIIMEGLL